MSYKKVSFFAVITSAALSFSPNIFAQVTGGGFCTTSSGVPHSYSFLYDKVITDPSENVVGIVPGDANLGDGSLYPMKCDCSNSDKPGTADAIFYSAQPMLAPGISLGGDQFFSINEYLQIASEIHIGGRLNQDVKVPFSNVSNGGNNGSEGFKVCDGQNESASTGSKVVVRLYIAKPFVGEVNIPMTKVVDLYGSAISGNFGGKPLASLFISGNVRVPQSCAIEAGSVIEIPFGDMQANEFNVIGKKPDSVAIQNRSLDVKCKEISAISSIDMRFVAAADPNYPSAIATSNKDIGVVLEDENSKLILPNEGKISVTLDPLTSRGSTVLRSYPVSTTGLRPAEGVFEGTATIRFDFK
jgi:type 1 fimbria pilin